MPTVREQLASVWNYISGAGTLVEAHEITVWRDGRWRRYSTFVPIDEVGFFRLGEAIWLYATQDCVLTHKGETWRLRKGWNNIAWLVDEGVLPPVLPPPPAPWMDMLIPIMGIVMMGIMMWPMIKRLFKEE